MKLIDADKLKNWLYTEPKYMDSRNDRTDIREYIDDMPTAYNPEKVVEQLKKQAHIDYPSQQMQTNIPRIMLCSAIDIVKKGGRNEKSRAK